jgi:hypothetical protein
MSISTKTLRDIERDARKQGCDIKWTTAGMRIKAPGGAVIVVHTTPARERYYLSMLEKKFRDAGLKPREGGWK